MIQRCFNGHESLCGQEPPALAEIPPRIGLVTPELAVLSVRWILFAIQLSALVYEPHVFEVFCLCSEELEITASRDPSCYDMSSELTNQTGVCSSGSDHSGVENPV